MRHHILPLAAFSFLLLARTASADASDDDDEGYVADEAAPATEVAPPKPVDTPPPPPPKEIAAKPKMLHARFDWGGSDETKPVAEQHARPQSEMRDQSPDQDPHRGLLGPVRFGALAGVGAPSIFSGEVLAKIGDYIGIAGDYGIAPTLTLPVGSAAVTVEQKTLMGSARVYPFRNWFFIGAGAGSQSVSATASTSTVTSSASFRTSVIFVEPQLGVLYRSSSGISFGTDVGLEFPLTAQRSNSVEMPGPLDRMMKYAEKGPIPTINLLRIGYVL